MKINNTSKYIFYIILFIIFILIRISHLSLSGEIENISLKGLAFANSFWPFGIIKECTQNSIHLPTYYLITGLLRNEILIKIFNIIVCIANILLLLNIGKKLSNNKLGVFLSVFLIINHFYTFYTSLIAPYCLIMLAQTYLIDNLIDYFKKPNKKNLKKLNLSNCALIFTDTFGFIFVACELLFLYLISKKKNKTRFSSNFTKVLNPAFIAFLIILPILIAQYAINSKLVIPNTLDGIGFNLSSLYLLLSEYTSPYLSFLAPENQSKSTLGLLYGFFMNPEMKSINTIKILITLFYSTILPIFITGIMIFKTFKKNIILKLIWIISTANFGLLSILMLFDKIETHPIYTTQFFIINLIILGYGIFKIKDNYIKAILITCLIAIQIINPKINSFNITIAKDYTVLNPIKNFIKEYDIQKEDVIIMPHGGHFASKILKKQTIFNYDNTYLQTSKKKGLIANIASKKTKTINQNNIQHLTKDYLLEKNINEYIKTYFDLNFYTKKTPTKRIILVIDKVNSKPISKKAISKIANQKNYSAKLRKIDFRYADLSQNNSKALLGALSSRTLYNFANIINSTYRLDSIVEYKKVDNEYYKIPQSNNIQKALNSFESDYAFIIFK